MGDVPLGLIELVLVFGGAFGFASHELLALRRDVALALLTLLSAAGCVREAPRWRIVGR